VTLWGEGKGPFRRTGRGGPGKAGVAVLLTGAVLAISACGINVHRWSSGNVSYTVTKKISDRIAIFCTADHPGDDFGRAICAFDTIHALCRANPRQGISDAVCREIASYPRWGEMDRAIRAVIGPQECLSFFGGPTPANGYWTAADLGWASCA
jgi:hypothetical protein